LKINADSVAGALTLSSSSASKKIILDLNGKLMSLTSISLSTRGSVQSSVAGARLTASTTIAVSANGNLDATNILYINCATNWDTSAGTWFPGLSSGASQVNMTGTGSTKLGASQYFNNLVMSPGVTRTLSSNVIIQNLKDMAGTLTEGAYSVTINGTSTNPARLNGTWSGVINITSSGASYTIYAANSWTGTLQTSKATTIITPAHKLIVTPAGSKWVNVTMRNGAFWCGSTSASASVTFAYDGWTVGTKYSVHADAVRVGGYTAMGGGYVNFTYASWSAHNITLDAYPTITSTALTAGIIGTQYSYDANASESGTWAITSSYADLDIDSSGIVSGFLAASDLGLNGTSITISLLFTDSGGGIAYQNYTIAVGTLTDYLSPYVQALLPIIIASCCVVVIVGAAGRARRKW
jgi:hypothetical protein